MPYFSFGKFLNPFRVPFQTPAENIGGGTFRSDEFILTGGNTGVIRSDNYDPDNDTGWAVFGDGTAIFNDITAVSGSIGALEITDELYAETAPSGIRVGPTTDPYIRLVWIDLAGTARSYLLFDDTTSGQVGWIYGDTGHLDIQAPQGDNTWYQIGMTLDSDSTLNDIELAIKDKGVNMKPFIARFLYGNTLLFAEGDQLVDITNDGVQITAAKYLKIGTQKHHPEVYFEAYRNGNQSIANGTNTSITWTETTDEGGDFASPTTQYICPVAGVYEIDYEFQWDGNATGIRIARILINGVVQSENYKTPGHANDVSQERHVKMKLAITDTIEVQVRQTSGGALNVLGDASGSRAKFRVSLTRDDS